jgi:deoxyribodipyrimidine photo-lyase
MGMNYQTTLIWLRRDLRLIDHRVISAALACSRKVYLAFVFDRTILDRLETKADRRVEFIWEAIAQIKSTAQAAGGDLITLHDCAANAIPQLAKSLGVTAVFCGTDYEPAAVERDNLVAGELKTLGIDFISIKDQVIFEKSEVLTQAGKSFSVFTPYKNAWLKRLLPSDLTDENIDLTDRFAPFTTQQKTTLLQLPSLAQMGFTTTNLKTLKLGSGASGAAQQFEEFTARLHQYDEQRDFPAVKGVSYLSIHLRFGTLSVRRLAKHAHAQWQGGQTPNEGAYRWLSELIWRDFYFQILHHYPHAVAGPFKREYEAIEWANDEDLFAAWCAARTGYPLIDAAMRQLNQTGFMHNRLRMVVASFLTKDLGIDWRWGERYFAQNLNDFDLSANNGGWQWAASTGCDAQPYFRIFNPLSQSTRFDPKGTFIRRYLPELAKLDDKAIHAPWQAAPLILSEAGVKLGQDYPHPIVDHDTARKQTLKRFEVVKKTSA